MKKWMLIVGIVVLCALAVLVRRSGGGQDTSGDAVAASVPGNMELVAEVGAGAFTYAVDADGTRAAFGRGRHLVVADVSDPARPSERYAIPLPGDILGVRLSGDRVYVAADTAGLRIVDIVEGVEVGSLRFDDRAYDVEVSEPYVFVAARSEGLRVVDVSDPANPVEIAAVPTPDEAVGVVIQGDYAYVADSYESMRVVNVSDPSAPEEVSFAPFSSYDHGAAWNVGVDGELAAFTIPEKGLRTVDITYPDSVRNHGLYYQKLRAPADVALRGHLAFVADQEAGLRVLDLTDPQNPAEIGAAPLSGSALTIRLDGDVAYVAAKEAGLRLVDISTPNDPREIGFLDDGDTVLDVVSAGGALLVAGLENGVYRYDGGSELVRRFEGRTGRIALDGPRVVTAGRDGVRVHEEEQVFASMTGKAHGVAARDGVIAAAEPLGVRILEAGSGGALQETGFFGVEWADDAEEKEFLRTPPAAWDVLLEEGRAYAAFDDGLYVLDLGGPDAPRLAGRIRTPERVYRLARSGDRLFAACDDGLRVLDVSGSSPEEVAFVRTPSYATSLLIDGDTVYVGDLSGRVLAVDVSGEDAQVTGTWHVADRVYALTRAEEGIAVAAGGQGLRIVSL